jgi:histidinol phosphatase-like enzyme (inositol monophosphatase family)
MLFAERVPRSPSTVAPEIRIPQSAILRILLRNGKRKSMNLEKELTVARKAAEGAGAIQLKYRKKLPVVEKKADDSPVTKVDRECEAFIRKTLLKKFPGDGFLGEETGRVEGSSGRMWIVDPLDGTRPYLRDIPTFSSLIGLEGENRMLVGVMHFPKLSETYYAAAGRGAFCNGVRIRVSSTSKLAYAIGSGFGFVEGDRRGKRLLLFMRQWDYSYGFMDAYSYAAVASGKLDLCVNFLDKPWDCAAAACVVNEAGGRFSDIRGTESVYSGSTVVSNGLLHEAIITYFEARHARNARNPR